MFKTGSMSPTIPAGSLAVVKEVPAAEVAVGDIVTVDRSPALPITHRVTSVSPAGEATALTLRGDANQADDPAPYVVTTVRTVLFSVPHLAQLVIALSHPVVLGSITLGAAGLVTWAFWPRAEPTPRTTPTNRHHANRHDSSRSLVLILLPTLILSFLAAPTPAQAAVSEEVIRGSVLTLRSIGDRLLMSRMTPGVAVPWQVGVAAQPASPGVVDISLSATGALATDPEGLQLTVTACNERWVGTLCGSGEALLLGPGSAASLLTSTVALTSMPSDQERWFLISASLPANPARIATGAAALVFSASGVGDEIATGENVDSLSRTGSNLIAPLLLAVAAVLVGLILARAAGIVTGRRRRF